MNDSLISGILLFIAHSTAALFAPIGDCDETFNYYEPVHYLLFGFAQQTWEYSAEFALRSWLYVSLHAAPLAALRLVISSKVTLFYALRIVIVLVLLFTQLSLLAAVRRRFGADVHARLRIFLVFSTGLFVSSAAFVPSSFAMAAVSLAVAFWFDDSPRATIAVTLAATVLGWPFASACLVPVALDILYRHGLLRTVGWGVVTALVVVVPAVAIDSLFYRRLVFPAFNIVWYNVLDSETSSELYGVEPLSYYLVNLLLNFNVVALLAALAPLCVAVSFSTRVALRNLWYLSPAYVWLAIMLPQPHKEERFLFVVYPLLCLCAAVASHELCRRWRLTRTLERLGAVAFVLLSVSRSASLVLNYRAPLVVWSHFAALPFSSAAEINVCVGQEWHRFPTSFFLPNENVRLRYVEAGFHGLLPKPFAPFPQGIYTVPSGMNRYNREERDRYVPLIECDYLVDLSLAPPRNGTWTVVADAPFLERSQTITTGALDRIAQLLYIPTLSERHLQLRAYRLFQQLR